MQNTYDTVIRHATLIDGTGAPRFHADIALDGGSIERIGDLGCAHGREEIDATGLVLAPGFIDSHTHDDRELLYRRDMTPKVSQGVTTVIGGNCGVSLAPMYDLSGAAPTPPLDILDGSGRWYEYRDFGSYLKALGENPAATNCAMLVGHTNLRIMEMRDLSRPAEDAEVLRMRKRVAEALDAGAIGVSTGLAYAPAAAASTEEVIAICRPLTAARGLYCTHMRDEGDDIDASLEETFRIGRELDVSVVISHHKLVGQANHGRSVETLKIIAGQMQKQSVCLDCYPYNASSTILTLLLVKNSARTIITWSRPFPHHAGRDLYDIAQEMGCPLHEAVDRLQPAGAVYFRMDNADVERILQFDETMIGSDGLPHDKTPHPRLWGTFARVLGVYSRQMGLFPLETAIHKMTGLTAKRFGLPGRGILQEGAAADVVLLNAEQVIDRATFATPTLPSAGIERVWTNGMPVWRDGKATGNRPGQVIRRIP